MLTPLGYAFTGMTSSVEALKVIKVLIPRQNCPRFRRKLPTHGLV